MNAWIDQHLEEFVKPHLGKIPDLKIQERHYLNYYDDEVFLGFMVKAWEEAKKRAGGRKIILAGRDVFLFEVLAQTEGFTNKVFRSEISGLVARSGVIPKTLYKDFYLIDTGYKGSVPRALGVEKWNLLYYAPPIDSGEKPKDRQLFNEDPLRDLSVRFAPNIECAPKYWSPGEVARDGITITQDFANENDFLRSTLLTYRLATFAKKEGFMRKLKERVLGS